MHGRRSVLLHAECEVYLLLANDFTSWNVKHVLKILKKSKPFIIEFILLSWHTFTLGNLTENVRLRTGGFKSDIITANLSVTPWKIKGEVLTVEKPVIFLGNSGFKSLKNGKSYEQQLPCENHLKEGHTC